jgi:hypothetical protein
LDEKEKIKTMGANLAAAGFTGNGTDELDEEIAGELQAVFKGWRFNYKVHEGEEDTKLERPGSSSKSAGAAAKGTVFYQLFVYCGVSMLIVFFANIFSIAVYYNLID